MGSWAPEGSYFQHAASFFLRALLGDRCCCVRGFQNPGPGSQGLQPTTACRTGKSPVCESVCSGYKPGELHPAFGNARTIVKWEAYPSDCSDWKKSMVLLTAIDRCFDKHFFTTSVICWAWAVLAFGYLIYRQSKRPKMILVMWSTRRGGNRESHTGRYSQDYGGARNCLNIKFLKDRLVVRPHFPVGRAIGGFYGLGQKSHTTG